MTQQYSEIIDKISGVKKLPCRTAEALRSPCGSPCINPLDDVALTNSPSNQNMQYAFSSNRFTGGGLLTPNDSQISKEVQLCPVCLHNMSWLPKYASCPGCGIKQIPIVEEIKPERKMTADEILKEYLDETPPVLDEARKRVPNENQSKCRCTCKYDKLCANCRLRKRYPDIMPPKSKEVDVAMESEEDADEDPEIYCLTQTRPMTFRPFLSRVLSELVHLYDIDLGKQKYRQNCEPTVKAATSLENDQPNGAKPAALKKKSPSKVLISSQKRRKTKNQIHKFSAKTKSQIHKYCTKINRPVARHHGWAWSSSKEARKYGWRPGAIHKSMKKAMNFFLNGSQGRSSYKTCNSHVEEIYEPPVLNLAKKNGEIFITLRPINNMNVQMNPIIFKVVKSELAVALSEIKKQLKAKGFSKCCCHKTVMMCVCRDAVEKKYLQNAIEDECRRRSMESCVDHLVLTDSSDSEFEFDFDVNTPAGIAKPPTSPKPLTANFSMQTVVEPKPYEPPFPIKYSPYMRFYSCAAGDRYTNTAFGDFKEIVFEDGVFGYRGGGPHGVHPGVLPKNKDIWGPAPGGPMRGGGGIPGGKSFPGLQKRPVKSDPIPVRMTKRYIQAREKQAESKKLEVKLIQGKPDMMQHMISKGAIPKPWRPSGKA